MTDALRKRYQKLEADKKKALGPNPKVIKSMIVPAGDFLALIKCTPPEEE